MKKIIMVENQEFNSAVKIGAHHYAELFAKNGYEVLWLSPAFSLLHFLSDYKITSQRIKLNKSKRVLLKENIYGYAPFVVVPFANKPLLDTKFIGKKYMYTSIPNLRRTFEKLGFAEVDLLWISNIKGYYIKDLVKHKKLVHRLSDEKSGFKNFYKTLSYFEEDLIKNSDVLFATANNLVRKAKKLKKDVIYLPNGVNYKDFQKVKYKYPSEYKVFKNQKKCIYIGAIAEWLDVDLIEYNLSKLPHIQFYFIGPNHGALDKLKKYTNLHILGKKAYECLPDYLHFSDIAIIPFKVNKLTDAINPVKIFEYLAAGVPTVTTSFKEINYIDGPYETAEDKYEFANKIKKLLSNNNDVRTLKKFAAKHDWEVRFKQMLKYL